MPPKKGKGSKKGGSKGGKNSTEGTGGGKGSGSGPGTPAASVPELEPPVQTDETAQTPQSQQSPAPVSVQQVPAIESEEKELVEGEDFFFEDTLREVLQESLDPATIEVVTYPTMRADDFVSAIDTPLSNRYGDLAQRLSSQIEDYEHRCNYAHLEHERWKADCYRLQNEKASLERLAEHERQIALNTSRKKRNGLQVLAARKSEQSVQIRGFLSSRDPANVFDIDYRGLDIADLRAGFRNQSSLRRFANGIARNLDRIFPLGRDVKVISSHFGLAAGSFFDFHRSLLQLSVLVLLCYLYLLIQQFAENWETLLWYPISEPAYPRLPSQFMIGGFHEGNVSEKWTQAFMNVSSKTGWNVSSNMTETEFNEWFSVCPIVRHVRDCRVASVFAGRIDRDNLGFAQSDANYGPYAGNRTYEYSPYGLFKNNFLQIPGTKNRDYVIVGTFGEILNPSTSFAPWTKTCDINVTGIPVVGYPGHCSESRTYWTGPFVLNATTQNWIQQNKNPEWILEYGSSIEVYTGTNCPVTSREDILQIVAGTSNAKVPLSGRDRWLALRYQVASVGSSLMILIVVLMNWYKAELVDRIEYETNEIQSVRWSTWVMACWDFRCENKDEQELWKVSFANELRAEMEEEINEDSEENRDRFKAWCLFAKRVLGVFISMVLLAAAWASIILVYIFQENITKSFASAGVPFGENLGGLAPNLTIAFVGLILPTVVKLITKFEERTRDSSARWNLYRLFFAKIFNALLYASLVTELVYSQPLVTERFLSKRNCAVDDGYQCAQDQAGVRLLGLLVSECFFSLFLKPVLRLFRAALAFAVVGSLSQRENQPPSPRARGDGDDDGEDSGAGDSERGRDAEAEDEGRAVFKFPEFEIADSAVDTVYAQFLMWLTVRYIPTAAIAVPVILFFHFKWLKITLKYLASRPFVTETTALRVNLQRVLLIIGVCHTMIEFISQFFWTPFEAQCGPYDSHQSPARMTLSLLPTDVFASAIDTLDWFTRSWLLVLVIAFICIFQNVLQLSVLRNANDSVLEQMHISGEEQQGYLRLRKYRLREKIDLFRKRISWLGDLEKSKGK